MHASTGAEVTFFGPSAFNCWRDDGTLGPRGGDAIFISIPKSTWNVTEGVQWCDHDASALTNYICKGKI